MGKKIKKTKTTLTTGAIPQRPLADAFRNVAGPALALVGSDPVPASLTWAMSVVATAWNASRITNEREGLAQLDASIERLKTPAFPDGAELGRVLEEIFHAARIRYPRDPRHAVKLFVEKRGPGDFHIEVVGGIPRT